MNQSAQLIGCLAKLALDGTTYTLPSAGTVSRTHLPPNDAAKTGPVSIWADLGIIAKASESVEATKIPIFRPAPGSYVLDDELESKPIRTLKCTVEECSNVMFMLLRRALTQDTPLSGAVGQFVPLTVSRVKAWVKFQRYSAEDNTLLDAEQLWAKLAITNAVEYGPEKHVQFELEIKQLWSPLTSGTAN
jgi:hypothetical protein